MQGSWDEECGPSPEKGCTAPRLKKVKALQQLTAELKKPDASPQAEQSPSTARNEETASKGTSQMKAAVLVKQRRKSRRRRRMLTVRPLWSRGAPTASIHQSCFWRSRSFALFRCWQRTKFTGDCLLSAAPSALRLQSTDTCSSRQLDITRGCTGQLSRVNVASVGNGS